MHTYGVINKDGTHIDVSKSERGAKQYATKNGYSKVSIRYNCGCIVVILSEKSKSGRWIKYTN